jgi:ribosomal protein L3
MQQIGHAQANAKPQNFVREIRLTELQITPAKCDRPARDQAIKFVDGRTSIGKGISGRHETVPFWRSGRCTERNASTLSRWHRCQGIADLDVVSEGQEDPAMGHERCTSRNNKLVSIDKDRNLLLKGAIPGPKGGYVVVAKPKTGIAKFGRMRHAAADGLTWLRCRD